MPLDANPTTIWRELRRWDARVQRAQARTLDEFFLIDGPLHLGHARRSDYAETRWEGSAQRARVLARVGRLCRACPAVDTHLRDGALPLSHVDLLARRTTNAAEAEDLLPLAMRLPLRELEERMRGDFAGSPTGDDPSHEEWVRVQLSAPAPVAAYVRETISLATALVGHDVCESDAVEAILAEASTEIEGDDSEASKQVELPCASLRRRRLRSTRSPAVDPAPSRGPRRDRAHRLDRRLQRLRHLERASSLAREEFLLQCLREGIHHRHGFRRFDDFAQERLSLAPSTAWDWIHRARARRRLDPLALALQRGLLSPVKVRLLSMLRRHGLGRRAWFRWIKLAARLTCRRLRRALHWARERSDRDLRAWAMESWRPPTPSQLRTFTPNLEEILRDPTLEVARSAPRGQVGLTLARETYEFLRTCLAALPRATETWVPVLHLFHLARTGWSQQVQTLRHPHRRILERDGYACAAPGCSSRRNLEVHHVVFRSRGGDDSAPNLVTLCATHHRALVHRGICRVERLDDGRLRWSLGIDAQGRSTERYLDETRLHPRPTIRTGPIRFRHGYCAGGLT